MWFVTHHYLDSNHFEILPVCRVSSSWTFSVLFKALKDDLMSCLGRLVDIKAVLLLARDSSYNFILSWENLEIVFDFSAIIEPE